MLRRSCTFAFLAALLLGSVAVPGAANAEVKLASCFSSHMVLQREMAVPIWGTAAPDEKVTVKFRDQTKSATADAKGNWRLTLDALKVGEPGQLVVEGSNKLTLEDVQVGEVWVGSGQSNMQGGAAGYAKGDEQLAKLLAAAPYAKVRLIRGKGAWQQADAANCPGFSALLLSFGVYLQKDLDVPVGLMLGAVGGTPSGRWVSQEAFAADEPCQKLVAAANKNFDAEAAKKKYAEALAAWEAAAEKAKKESKPAPGKPQPPTKPSEAKVGDLYEANIRQFVGYGIRGVLWDQGESGTAVPGVDQYTLMGALIRGWRKEWGQGDFPFLYVQKKSGGGCAWDPADPVTNKAEKFSPLPAAVPDANGKTAAGAYRELHIKIMTYPKTAMVTATDLGSGIHPSNKSGYGFRAKQVALGMVYGKPVEYYGPVYAKHTAEGSKIRVQFTHVGKGLATKHADKLQGFAIAGEDNMFHWADAVIDGETVVVSSPKVPNPKAVRYAWADSTPWANLFNADGLPALTFRTDSNP